IITAYNATIAILAALRHRDAGGGGQALDISLLDCGIAALTHFAQNYLITGEIPERRGNGGYGGIPSQAFMCADREIFVVAGNDAQFARLCQAVDRLDLQTDPRFRSGPLRIENRKVIVPILEEVFRQRPAAHWLAALEAAGVPVSYVNTIAEVFEEPQVKARGMRIETSHPQAGLLPLIANPLRFSETPVEHYFPPPELGEHTDSVLGDFLGIDDAQIAALRDEGVIA
ncbi:MAG: CoA transferase, partial [Novosphingobium sp.]|nr:CoA transferase [Novosphingobium sp.]